MKTKFNELNFNGVLIQLTQSSGFDMMVNATEMAKPFGPNKRPSFWMRLPSIVNIMNVMKNELELLPYKSIKGLRNDRIKQGTWMCEYLAILYSKYLNLDVFSKLINILSEVRISESPEKVYYYDRYNVIEFMNCVVDNLNLTLNNDDNLDIIEEDSDIKFIFGESLKVNKRDLFYEILKCGNNIFILKTINIFHKYFIEKKDKNFIYSTYYILPTLIDNITYVNNSIDIGKSQKTYLMRDSNTGYTKIGKAKDPKFRERTLQSEKPTISLFATCDSLVEPELHKKFESKRIRGEWFLLSEEDINYIMNNYKFYENKYN